MKGAHGYVRAACLAGVVLKGSTLCFSLPEETTWVVFCAALQHFGESAVAGLHSVGLVCGEPVLLFLLVLPCACYAVTLQTRCL